MYAISERRDGLAFPFLLNSRETSEYLGINNAALQRTARESHTLYLPGHTRRYGLPYTFALKHWADISPHNKSLTIAKEFARTAIARSIMDEEEQHLSSLIEKSSDNGLVRAADVGRILQVGRPTVTGWIQNAGLESVRQGPHLYIPEPALRETCQWQTPEVLHHPEPE